MVDLTRRMGLVALVVVAAFLGTAATAMAAPVWQITTTHAPAAFQRGDLADKYVVTMRNVGDAPTTGTDFAEFTADLPDGIEPVGMTPPPAGFTCDPLPAVRCVRNTTANLAVNGTYVFTIIVRPGDAAADNAMATFTASHGGAATVSVQDFVTVTPRQFFGIKTFTTSAKDEGGADLTQAGGHPFSANASFSFPTFLNEGVNPGDGNIAAVENPRTVTADLPAGFIGNPETVDTCPLHTLANVGIGTIPCPASAAVGYLSFYAGGSILQTTAIYRMIPEKGYPAEFGFVFAAVVGAYGTMYPTIRSDGDYGISVRATVPKSETWSLSTTFCGFGVEQGGTSQNPTWTCKSPSHPQATEPFLTNPTDCSAPPPTTFLSVNSWEHPDVFKTASYESPALTGCDQLEFEPTVTVTPETTQADAPSGVNVHIGVPQTSGASTPATPPLKDAVVTLPEGVSLNAGVANGLEGCTDAQAKLGTLEHDECPEASKVGTVHIATPVLPEGDGDYLPDGPSGTHYQLTGSMYLRTPDPGADRTGLYSLFLVVDDEQTGVMVKLRGQSVPDPVTGQLKTTFLDNPQLPFTDLLVRLKTGPRAPLATPATCGAKTTSTLLSSWGGPAASPSSAFDVSWDGNGAACPATLPFAPGFEAGSDSRQAGTSSPFSVRVDREDRHDVVDGLEVDLPEGLLADVSDVAQCADADANAGTCPAASRIGTATAAAGAGSSPYFVSGPVYLTQGYKGAPYGLSVAIRAVAGPLDLGTVVVRQAVSVDPNTAQVTATSDPIPVIREGAPFRLKTIHVKIDRPGFMQLPTSCDPQSVDATVHSLGGQSAAVSSPFRATGCPALPFAPKLALSLVGKRQVTTGTHPRVKAQVNQTGIGEAGIEKAVVRLPKSLALDPDNAQALCEFEDGTKPDLEKRCPKGSIVGRARAKTPLLHHDLAGDVYFVKNVRKDPKTGNTIRTLPMIVVALRGEIAINLKGESSTTKDGRLVNTFAAVPDAPITQFNLNIAGGPNGILVVTQTRKGRINICASRQTAEADIDGQNGRNRDLDVRIKTPCTKQQRAAAKRAAKRAARARS